MKQRKKSYTVVRKLWYNIIKYAETEREDL